MALNGLQIFKYLPAAKKTEFANCKECGFPTCMAYSLKLAQKLTTPEKCPHMPDDLKEIVCESMKRQQLEVLLGADKSVKIGGENVIFRHEKTFVNRPPFAIQLNSDDKDLDEKLDEIKSFSIDRVGELFKVDVIYLKDNGNLQSAAEKVVDKGFALIIESDADISAYSNYNAVLKSSAVINDKDAIINVEEDNLDSLLKKSENFIKDGYKNLVLSLNFENKSTKDIIEEMTLLRRKAIIDRFEPATFPVITKVTGKDDYEILALASLLVCRYSSLIVFEKFDKALLATLATLRQNIYTDPQKPLQVESKIYEINEPDENSLIMLTTNFALTYFAVSSELESIGLPTYLIVTPSDGMSVLTAWSADKFTAEMIKKMLKDTDFASRVKNKSIIIPGLLAHMKEELEEVLEDWEIVVGTTESYMIPEFVKELENGQR